MDYFSKFLRTTQPNPKVQVDRAQEFHKSWNTVKVKSKSLLSARLCKVSLTCSIQDTLLMPDERQLTKGIDSTDVPAHLQSMVDSLVWESTRNEDG